METAIKISPVNIEARKSLDLRAGDTIKVHQKIKEKDKTRIQLFEGLVLAVKHGKEAGGTFTVRKVASGVGVEKIFPLYSPNIEKIEIVKRSKVRQSKLYHIREKAAKAIRREMRKIRQLPDEIDETIAPVEEVKTEDIAEAPVENTEAATETPAEEVKEEASTEEKTEESK
jgi:large subunit ribosomal protein L19